MIGLVTDEARAKQALRQMPLGSRYYKCYVKPYDLVGKEIDEPEFWGYSLAGSLKEAKKQFSRAIDEGLDVLDYGYMEIVEYELHKDVVLKGRRIGAYVNNFGKWLTKETFLDTLGVVSK